MISVPFETETHDWRVGVIVLTHQQELSDHDGYELFRRAIVERADDAWTQIHAHFRPLLVAWSRQYCARSPADEHFEDIADRALARAWAALSPEHFGQFPNLATLLAYLRSCVAAAVIDTVRATATRERAYQKLDAHAIVTPEEIVVEESSRAALWQAVRPMVANEQERIVLLETFVLALPPRQIQARHADHFADVVQVYSAKRNLLNRLARSHALQRLYDELRA